MINIMKKIFKTGIVTERNPILQEAPDSLRGKIKVARHVCTGCEDCVQACPVDAISFKRDGQKARLTFDYSKCMYCGLCVDVCPTDALSHMNRLKESVKDPADLIETYIVGEGVVQQGE